VDYLPYMFLSFGTSYLKPLDFLGIKMVVHTNMHNMATIPQGRNVTNVINIHASHLYSQNVKFFCKKCMCMFHLAL
jgi:hypothetical protein